MFKKILIANRGEIAVRVIKTCKRLGIETVVVYSEADADSLAVDMADEAVLIGPPAPGESYLKLDTIVDVAKQTGAEAVHPGFGFLSENAAFPKALEKAGIGWVGPNVNAIEAMGDKIRSKQLAAASGVSTIPGADGEIHDVETAVVASKAIGYPVMIKASAGGGGKGMRIARDDDEVKEGFVSARNEAKTAFGDDRILIEKFVEQPRHIEIQVLGDKHDNVIFLNERECSIQRRNQKVIEEAPSPFLDRETRKAMGAQAVALAAAVDYDSAGTVEFIVDKDLNFYFLEMNTRLQVEHPVTEMICEIDLVEQMLRVASGEALEIKQRDVRINGWAVEARLYAEDPYRGFLPSIGRLKRLVEPAVGKLGDGELRIDSGVREGDEISLFYDPMIAKVIGYGETRDIAIETLNAGLDRLYIDGLQSNAPFLSAVLGERDFKAGKIHTGYIDQHFPDGFSGTAPREEQLVYLACAAAYVHETMRRRAECTDGRISPLPENTRREWVVMMDGRSIPVEIDCPADGEASIWAPSLRDGRQNLKTGWHPGQNLFQGEIDGEEFALEFRNTQTGYRLRHRGYSVLATVCSSRSAQLYANLPEREKPDTAKLVTSPMPGLVVAIEIEAGQEVKAGQSLMIVEAMKMENVIRAEKDGVIKSVNVATGASVAADELMIEFE
jgi:propionyl-CoA carboxylase alpha chain